MPAFVAAMLVVVFSHYIVDDLPGALPAGAFALVFACLARGAPARKPMKWNVATVLFSLQALMIVVVGIAMLSGDDSIIPYLIGSILAGHAQAMQPFCGLFMIVALVFHYVIGDIEGCPMIVGFVMLHLYLGLFWKEKDDA